MKLIGMKKELHLGLKALERNQPVLYYGFTGNGKTLLAWELANKYSKENNVPIVYLQLYPEMTKNSLIGGETIKDGSIVVEEQTILKMGTKGAVFIVDECTHTTEPVLLAFNSLIEEPYSTVVGDKIHKLSDKTRFIFCGNLPDHAGNITLPASFANRLFIIKTGMPDKKMLSEIGNMSCKGEADYTLLNFVADIILQCHEPAFPVSPRNMVIFAKAVIDTYQTGFPKDGCENLPANLQKVCVSENINPDILKEVILSSLMANTISKSQGPDKVKALLWD